MEPVFSKRDLLSPPAEKAAAARLARRPRSLQQESPTACGGICLAAGDPDKSGDKAPAGRPPIHTAMMAAKL
jgi:hypothetical protein